MASDVTEPAAGDTSAGTQGGASTAVIAASYVALGLALSITRLADLGHSFWHDEIYAVSHYIRLGPLDILAGPGISHELFSVLASASRPLAGDSEIVFRLWSAVPFLVGVALVTVWLHLRIGALSGILFLYLATVSPLLLDITRQARGYGLAFLAMATMIVAALEAVRGAGPWAIGAFCVAGALGTSDLPQFGIAFFATALVLLSDPRLRKWLALGLPPFLIVALIWWGPHLRAVYGLSQIEDGVQLHGVWVVTAPIDQVLIPALIWIDGTALVAGVIWLPLILVALLLMSSSPLVRDPRTALILASGVVATVVVLWIGQAFVIPRYLSFLLVPLFILLATGMAATLGRLDQRPVVFRTIASLVVLGVLAIRFLTIAPDVVRLPREAHRDAANTVEKRTPAGTPVLSYLRHPEDLDFYLEEPAHALRSTEVAARVCRARTTIAYVVQAFGIPRTSVPCLTRAGVEHYRFRQYARGEMNVWIVPPAR